MPAAYLTPGSTSLVAGSWSDLTGVVDSAELFISSGAQDITGGVAPSLTNGIANLDVLGGFVGTVGSPAARLAVETRSSLFDPSTQLPRVRYWPGAGRMHYTPEGAGAAANVCDYLQVAGDGALYVSGTGSIKRLEVDSGTVLVPASVASVATHRWVLTGGAATIDGDTSSTRLHALTVSGGAHLLKRGVQGTTLGSTGVVESLNVCGGNLTIDAVEQNNISELRMYGGVVKVLNVGTISAVSGYGGILDFSQLQRPATLTLLEDARGLIVFGSRLLTITAYSGATNGRQPIGRGCTGLQ